MASSKWSWINYLNAVLCFITCQMFGRVLLSLQVLLGFVTLLV